MREVDNTVMPFSVCSIRETRLNTYTTTLCIRFQRELRDLSFSRSVPNIWMARQRPPTYLTIPFIMVIGVRSLCSTTVALALVVILLIGLTTFGITPQFRTHLVVHQIQSAQARRCQVGM